MFRPKQPFQYQNKLEGNSHSTGGLPHAEITQATRAAYLALQTDIRGAQVLAGELQDILGVNLPYINLFYTQANDLANINIEFPYTDVLGGISNSNGFQSDTLVFAK